MTTNYHNRQMGIIDPSKLDIPIAIVGGGGIGSWTSLIVAKMGASDLTVYDFDSLEEHNIGSQLYSTGDIGKPKVEALSEFIKSMSGQEIKPINQQVNSLVGYKVVILAVDNMESRKQIFESLKNQPCLLIDGRMIKNTIEIDLAVMNDPQAVNRYASTLFSDDASDPIPCSERSVAYNCSIIAGLISDIVAKYANGKPIPYEVLCDLENMTLDCLWDSIK